MYHATLLTSALAFLSGASAFALPSNPIDGIYQVRRSANGAEVHSSLSPAPIQRRTSPSIPASHQLAKREDSWGNTYCGCGFDLNHADTDAAVADLKAQLTADGKYIEPGLSYYSIRGGVVAFACNLDHQAILHVWEDVITQAAGQITNACGEYVAGSEGGHFDFAIGYMRSGPNVDFCGGALTSPANSCPK